MDTHLDIDLETGDSAAFAASAFVVLEPSDAFVAFDVGGPSDAFAAVETSVACVACAGLAVFEAFEACSALIAVVFVAFVTAVVVTWLAFVSSLLGLAAFVVETLKLVRPSPE